MRALEARCSRHRVSAVSYTHLLRPTAVATAVKLMALPALFLPAAVHLGFTDEKLGALLVMLGSIATPSCYVMAKQMGHEGVLTGSVCVTTTLFLSLIHI